MQNSEKKKRLGGNLKPEKECASPESNRGLNDGNVEFYH